MTASRQRLVDRLVQLVDAGAVTGSEATLAAALADELGAHGPVVRVGDSLVVGEPYGQSADRPCIALVGHLDVVPPTDDDGTATVTTLDGTDVVVGRGTSDMHGGNAVAIELFTHHPATSPYDLALVLYAREEGPAAQNELADVLEEVPWLADVDLAIVLEPTDGVVHLGCLGGVHATVTFVGRQAHSARPWHGRNALTAAGRFLTALDELAPLDVPVDGIAYRDVWSATQAMTDNARNVIPARFTVNLNYRFSPRFSTDDAVAALREQVRTLTEGLDPEVLVEVEVIDLAPPAPPQRGAELVSRLLAAVEGPVEGKQAWTDVARLAALGVPAVNYGPGLTAQAHQRGEHVHVDALVDVHERLGRLLAGPATA